MRRLHDILFTAPIATSSTIADTQGHCLSYSDFKTLSQVYVSTLANLAIGQGDRVVLLTEKSVHSLALLFAVLKSGAVYVPISTSNSAERIHTMLADISPSLICTEINAPYEFAYTEQGLDIDLPFTFYKSRVQGAVKKCSPDTAAILYTSGSSGYPKGVVLSHNAMLVFAEWALATIPMNDTSRVASIAGYHFDLSVFDIYTTMMAGASLYLYDDKTIRNPLLLAQLLSQDKISHLYATPTLLQTLVQFGKMQKHDWSALTTVLFAGEVYPIVAFRLLKELLPKARFYNLYGPTETNVCTYYEVATLFPQRFPIGQICPYAKYMILDEKGNIINDDSEGELVVAGESLFTGYWNDEEKTARAFYTDKDGLRYYHTGDIVYRDAMELLYYKGRRDRMFKRRGYRIEPAEVERLLTLNTALVQVAVWAAKADDGSAKMYAAVVSSDKTIDEMQMKAWCKQNMPDWMLPDKFIFMVKMPLTASGKIDLQTLVKSTAI